MEEILLNRPLFGNSHQGKTKNKENSKMTIKIIMETIKLMVIILILGIIEIQIRIKI
jgi:hypothetical protein